MFLLKASHSDSHPPLQAAQLFKALATIPATEQLAEGEYVPLERMAQQNRLACIVAERAAAGGSQLDLKFEFTQHRSYPVAVLKSKKGG